MKRPEENYGLDGLPTEVEYLRSDRRWLVEENNTLRAALENIAKNSKGLIRRAATQALEGSGYRDRGRERSADTSECAQLSMEVPSMDDQCTCEAPLGMMHLDTCRSKYLPTVVECPRCYHLFVRAELSEHLATHVDASPVGEPK